jgi:hypothetical protein
LDKSEINFEGHWRSSIPDDILKNNRALSFLSKRSLPQNLCKNCPTPFASELISLPSKWNRSFQISRSVNLIRMRQTAFNHHANSR